ncbi:MAG: hypothetical protein EAX87_06360 [Candidatus Thorarchaeota archaeon]|nr:hypothetical protein [Candidatus Thorarchaeota archaeon]
MSQTQLRNKAIASVTKPMNLLEVIHSDYDFANYLKLWIIGMPQRIFLNDSPLCNSLTRQAEIRV